MYCWCGSSQCEGHFLQRRASFLSVQSAVGRKRLLLASLQSGEGRRASPSAQQQRRSVTHMHTKHTHSHTHMHRHTHTHAVSLSAAGVCPVWGARVMALYAAHNNALSDEQEYLQAYEDVLEKYKGRDLRWLGVCYLPWGPGDETAPLPLDSSINVSLPPLPLLTGRSKCLYPCCGKSGNISCMTSHSGSIFGSQDKGFIMSFLMIWLGD